MSMNNVLLRLLVLSAESQITTLLCVLETNSYFLTNFFIYSGLNPPSTWTFWTSL